MKVSSNLNAINCLQRAAAPGRRPQEGQARGRRASRGLTGSPEVLGCPGPAASELQAPLRLYRPGS